MWTMLIQLLIMMIPDTSASPFLEKMANLHPFLEDIHNFYSVKSFIYLNNETDENKFWLLRKMKNHMFSYHTVWRNEDTSLEDALVNPMFLFVDNGKQDLEVVFRWLKNCENRIKYTWMVMTTRDLAHQLENLYIPFDAIFIVAQVNLNTYQITMRTVYKTNESSILYADDYGSWDEDRGLQVVNPDRYITRQNIYGSLIKVALPPQDQGVGLRGTSVNSITLESWRVIAASINAETEIVIGELAELDLQPTTFLIAPNKHIQHFPIFSFKSELFYKEVAKEMVWTKYLNPFVAVSWFGLLAWGSLTVAAMSFAAKHLESSQSGFLFNIFAVLSQQGSQFRPKEGSVFFVWMVQRVSFTIIFATYSAVFISFITVVFHKSPFVNFSLEEVLQLRSYNIIAVRTTSYVYFKYEPNIVVQKLKECCIPPEEELPLTYPKMFEILCRSERILAAFPRKVLNQLIELQQDCQISPRAIHYKTFQTSWIHINSWKFGHLIQVLTMKLKESGVLNTNFLWMRLFPTRVVDNSIIVEPISLEDVASVLTLLLVGAVLSVLLLAYELCIGRKEQNTKQKIGRRRKSHVLV